MQIKKSLVRIMPALLAILFSLIATSVISYIAMATPIGPWMEMTLVLIGTIIFRVCAHQIALATQMRSLAFATAAGGIGGAVAMACAFSFPTLYFLDPALFNAWMVKPFYFSAILAGLVLAAGSFGFLIAHHWRNRFLTDESMIFPIGQMVYNMIAIQNQFAKAVQLAWGAAAAVCYSIIQSFLGIIPARLTLLPAFNGNIFSIPYVAARTDMLPMFWAIGFTTGHVIAIPLLIAVIAKLALVDPLHKLFFLHLSHTDYVLAFGAGMAIQGALLGLIDLPKILKNSLNMIKLNIKNSTWFDTACGLLTTNGKKQKQLNEEKQNSHILSSAIGAYRRISKRSLALLLPAVAFLTYFRFSIPAQLYLTSFTVICAISASGNRW